MKILVKTGFIVFFLWGKDGLPMDPSDQPVCPIDRTLFNNRCIEMQCLHGDYLSFHDLWHYSQTNQENNRIVKDYFAHIPAVVGYFKELHRIMLNAPDLDQEKVWGLAKNAATCDLKVQSWILNYARRYITDHFLEPVEKREMSSHLHQGVYIIRSFQGCDVNFKADLFISKALERSLATLNDLNAKQELKGLKHNFSSNPKETVRYLQIIKFKSYPALKEDFIKIQNCFLFLWLYSSNQEIYNTIREGCSRLQRSGDEELLNICINVLLMRRAKESIKATINRLLVGEKGAPSWVRGTKIFLECYGGWKFNIPLEDEDMKQGIGELHKLTSVRHILFDGPARKVESHKYRRVSVS